MNELRGSTLDILCHFNILYQVRLQIRVQYFRWGLTRLLYNANLVTFELSTAIFADIIWAIYLLLIRRMCIICNPVQSYNVSK